MKKLIILLIVTALVCLACTAIAAGDGISFDTSVNTVNEGETLQTVLNREGEAAEGEITYTTSDQKTATVDQNGLITAVKKGRAVITATVKSGKKTYKAQLKLTVNRPVTSVSVKTDKLPVYSPTDEKVAPFLTARENAEENELPVLLLPVKKKYQLSAVTEPKDASNRNVIFTSSDDSVFTAVKGSVAGVTSGEGILTAASESNPEVSTRYRVLVVQPVTKLTVEASAPSVTVGGQVTVSSVVTPENATLKNVTWSSGDERIVTVDANGTVTGIKRGTGRIIATAADGSNIRANYSIKVVQNPEKITLPASEMTVDVGRNAPCKATIEPKNADNKKLIWSSSDESIATVDKTGRIKGVSVGECTITCTSEALDSVTASLTVHVQQPVKKLSFNSKTALVFVDETTQLAWTIEPSNATNQKLTFKSAKPAIATVDENGLISGIKSGKTSITAMTTDGSKRKANIGVHVGKHVTGVHMTRKHAYIDKGEVASTTAKIEPKDALIKNMTWESSDPGVVQAKGTNSENMKLSGVGYGNAVVTGTTEDGGFQTSIKVTVADFDHGLLFESYDYDAAGNLWCIMKNKTDFTITEITVEYELWDCSGEEIEPAVINTKNGSGKVEVVWKGSLAPGQKTSKNHWKNINYTTPSCGMDMTRGQITLVKYQIENDWIKTIRKNHRQYQYWN